MGKLSWRNEKYGSKLKFQNFTVFEFEIHMIFQSKQFNVEFLPANRCEINQYLRFYVSS